MKIYLQYPLFNKLSQNFEVITREVDNSNLTFKWKISKSVNI